MRHYVSAIIALVGLGLIVVGAIMNHNDVGGGFAIILGLAWVMAGLFSGALKAIVPRSHRR